MNVTFEPGEEIMMTVHKHWFVFFTESVFFTILALIPLVFLGLGGSGGLIDGARPVLFFAGLWYLFVWILFFVKWTDYYLDVFILTNKRVIYVSQKSLFSRRISSTRLDRIQDVSAEVTGMMETFLNYGSVHVQTAGEEQEFILKNLPNPDLVKNKILMQFDSATRGAGNIPPPASQEHAL